MRGLPFRASTEDVVAFFKGFQVLPETLHLGTDNLGRPSGEGWITFSSQEEAKVSVGIIFDSQEEDEVEWSWMAPEWLLHGPSQSLKRFRATTMCDKE